MSKHFGYVILIFLSFGFSFGLSMVASASCCFGVSKLEWRNSAEVLEYVSCGCADSCWVAEVKNKKTGRLKARLSCNCEKAYFSIGPGKIGGKSERLYANDCSSFEGLDKFEVIEKTMHQILTRH